MSECDFYDGPTQESGGMVPPGQLGIHGSLDKACPIVEDDSPLYGSLLTSHLPNLNPLSSSPITPPPSPLPWQWTCQDDVKGPAGNWEEWGHKVPYCPRPNVVTSGHEPRTPPNPALLLHPMCSHAAGKTERNVWKGQRTVSASGISYKSVKYKQYTC